MFAWLKRQTLPSATEALPGRPDPIPTAERHYVTGTPLAGPYPKDTRVVTVGMGCFWGAERMFWSLPGVHVTAVGYAAGTTPNPIYEEVCSGLTGHNEVVRIVYRPEEISLEDILRVFWEGHDPTQGMRQGNDVGTQYRSGIYVDDADQAAVAQRSRDAYEAVLKQNGFPAITTEIVETGPFYFAEDYHQQYLARNPGGYCGLGGTGVTCPTGLGVAS